MQRAICFLFLIARQMSALLPSILFYNDTTNSEISTLSLHDALPILQITRRRFLNEWEAFKKVISRRNIRRLPIHSRSEERFSRNAETDIVCRLLLEKKKQ